MKIRLYENKDAASLAELFIRSVVEIGPKDYTRAQVEAWAARAPGPEDVAARCADGRTVLVAVDGHDTVLAYGELEADGHLDHLYCLPEAAGKGIASALYDALEAVAYQEGLTRIYTEASEAARRLFLHKGFDVLHKREFCINHIMIHNYAMEKNLNPI